MKNCKTFAEYKDMKLETCIDEFDKYQSKCECSSCSTCDKSWSNPVEVFNYFQNKVKVLEDQIKNLKTYNNCGNKTRDCITNRVLESKDFQCPCDKWGDTL